MIVSQAEGHGTPLAAFLIEVRRRKADITVLFLIGSYMKLSLTVEIPSIIVATPSPLTAQTNNSTYVRGAKM